MTNSYELLADRSRVDTGSHALTRVMLPPTLCLSEYSYYSRVTPGYDRAPGEPNPKGTAETRRPQDGPEPYDVRSRVDD